ncbi:MAG: carbohydrate ABC transporter permease [Spirochaetia bacterium]|nr:carbohydrate ABC transporter permease [Spirochaetia bacterium]
MKGKSRRSGDLRRSGKPILSGNRQSAGYQLSAGKLRRKRDPVWIHAVLLTAVFLVGFPVVFALIKATQNTAQVLSPSMRIGSSLLYNAGRVLGVYKLGLYMKNSFIIALIVTVGKITLSFFAAFGLVYFKFRGKKILFAFIIITLMMPTEVLILGLFDLISKRPALSFSDFAAWFFNPAKLFFSPIAYGFGWSSSYLAIIVPFLASATGVFLFRQHFTAIPRSLADSARIDGAGPVSFIFHVLIPMSWNTIGALALIQFVYVWDQYLWPRVIVRYDVNQVVQVGLKNIIATGDSVYWGEVMAAAVMAMIPPLIVFSLLYRAFMRGYALSSNK